MHVFISYVTLSFLSACSSVLEPVEKKPATVLQDLSLEAYCPVGV